MRLPNFRDVSAYPISILLAAAALANAQTRISNVISFEVNEGGDVPHYEAILLRGSAGTPATGRTADIAVDIKPGPSWLSVTPASGTVPLVLFVNVDPAGLAPGKYSGAILSTIGSGSSLVTFKDEVDLQVDAVPPALTVAPGFLTFKGLSGGPRAVKPLLVYNHGGRGTLDFTAATDSPWLTVQPGAGKTESVVLANVDFGSLPAGVFQGNISVAGTTGDPSGVPVNVLALPSGPALGVSQTGLVFPLTAGAGTTESGVVSILNQGDSGMLWTADVLIGSKFLSVNPAAGTVAPGGGAPLTIAPQTAAKPNASDLAAGDYYGLVRITAPGAANSPQYVLTILNVTGGPHVPAVRPAGLILQSAGAAATGKLRISGSATDKYTFVLNTASADGQKWLTASPSSGSVTSATPADITVTAAAGLKPGIYPAEVDIQLTSSVAPPGLPAGASIPSSNVTVAVLLVVLPAGAKLTDQRNATTGCTPSKLGMVQSAQTGGFSTSAGWPTPLVFTVVDDCANPVSNAQVITTFSNGDPPLTAELSDAAAGQYTATWVPRNATSTTLTAKATAAPLTPAQVRNTGFVGTKPAPILSRNGVVHRLKPQPGAPLAPGTLIRIDGAHLSTADATPADVPLPTVVNGTSVLFGAYSAPLISLSDGTLGAQLPVELAPNNQYPVVVIVNDAISMPDMVTVAGATPGIQASDDGYAMAQHPDGNAVTAANPASPGETVSIFLGGLGATDPVVPSGVQAPATEPLARITTPATVTLNGIPTSIIYAGLAPGQVGLYRIDLTVAPDASPGDSKLSVSQNGLNSNTVLLTIGLAN